MDPIDLTQVFERIQTHLATDKNVVMVGTPLHTTCYRRAEDFRLNSQGVLQVRAGRGWNRLGANGILFVRIRFA